MRLQVMLAKNLGVHRGLVNGARGVVVGFEPGTKGQCQIIFASRFFNDDHIMLFVINLLNKLAAP